jgi:Tfp pilus assembly protein PilE
MIKNQTLFPCLSSYDKGFTLIELFIIVVIIGILTTLFISKYKSIIEKTQFAVTRANLERLQRQVWLYYTQEGVYPSNLNILVEKGYISKIPEIVLPYYSRTNMVITSVEPYDVNNDTGRWYYNPTTGQVLIECTHKDLENIEIYKW